MFSNTKSSMRRAVLTAVVSVALSVAACVPARLGTSWPALRTVGEEQNILVAYNDQIIIVDPIFGRPVELREPDGAPVVDGEGKKQVWTFKIQNASPSQFYSAPILVSSAVEPQTEATSEPVSADNTTLLVATFDSKQILKLDLRDAREKRSVPLDGHVLADLALQDDTLYVPFSDKDIVALDPDDLSVRWKFTTEHGIWSEPLVVDNVVYFSSMDHYLYAVDARTGSQRWKLDLEGAATSTPVHRDGHLYIGSFARKVFDISTDGEKLGEYPTKDWVWGSPLLIEDTLYVADMGGYVYALNTKDGLTKVWETHAATMGIRPTPVVHGDWVIVASRDGRVYWLNRSDGAVDETKQVEIGAEILSDMLVVDKTPEPFLIVSTVDPSKLLVALQLDGSGQAWKYPQ